MPHSTSIKTIKANAKDYVLNLDSKSNLKSNALDSTLEFNPLDSNLNFVINPKFLDSIIKSKFHSNLKVLIFNQLIPKLLTLQEYFKFTFFDINKFIINICYNVFNFIKVNILHLFKNI